MNLLIHHYRAIAIIETSTETKTTAVKNIVILDSATSILVKFARCTIQTVHSNTLIIKFSSNYYIYNSSLQNTDSNCETSTTTKTTTATTNRQSYFIIINSHL